MGKIKETNEGIDNLKKLKKIAAANDLVKAIDKDNTTAGVGSAVSKYQQAIDCTELEPFRRFDLKQAIQANKKKQEDRDPDKLLGLYMRQFPTIEQDTDGIQPGMYLIGADTNIGKTALLVNMFLSIMDSNPDTYGLYFSLDDDTATIIDRMVASKTRLKINDIKKSQSMPLADQQKRDLVYSELDQKANDRFNIIDLEHIGDCDNPIEKIEQYINEAKATHGANVFVAMDGLHNLDVSGEFENQRLKNVERANVIKRLSKDIPVIVTCELRKRPQEKATKKPKIFIPSPDDIMETGKYKYNANLIWLLWVDNPDWISDPDCDLYIKLRFAKNKLSGFKGTHLLRFKRDICHFEEPSGDQQTEYNEMLDEFLGITPEDDTPEDKDLAKAKGKKPGKKKKTIMKDYGPGNGPPHKENIETSDLI